MVQFCPSWSSHTILGDLDNHQQITTCRIAGCKSSKLKYSSIKSSRSCFIPSWLPRTQARNSFPRCYPSKSVLQPCSKWQSWGWSLGSWLLGPGQAEWEPGQWGRPQDPWTYMAITSTYVFQLSEECRILTALSKPRLRTLIVPISVISVDNHVLRGRMFCT